MRLESLGQPFALVHGHILWSRSVIISDERNQVDVTRRSTSYEETRLLRRLLSKAHHCLLGHYRAGSRSAATATRAISSTEGGASRLSPATGSGKTPRCAANGIISKYGLS